MYKILHPIRGYSSWLRDCFEMLLQVIRSMRMFDSRIASHSKHESGRADSGLLRSCREGQRVCQV